MGHNGNKNSIEIVEAVYGGLQKKMSYTRIGNMLGITRSRVAGIVDRRIKEKPGHLKPGSLGVIEKQLSDKKRITLISIPSLGKLQEEMPYSYIPRDQSFGKRKTDRQLSV